MEGPTNAISLLQALIAFFNLKVDFLGHYLHVSLDTERKTAVLISPEFPPPPKYHSNASSPFYKSCKVSTIHFQNIFPFFLIFLTYNLFPHMDISKRFSFFTKWIWTNFSLELSVTKKLAYYP